MKNFITPSSINKKRFNETLIILGRYQIAGWLSDYTPQSIKNKFVTAQGEKIETLSFEEKFRLVIEELGTTYIKLGQLLSTRSDLIGEELATELKKLQSDIPADSKSMVIETFKEEFGKTPEELFKSFNYKPIGSASIGQAHQAELEDGTIVVVKVQHRGVDERVNDDLNILKFLAAKSEQLSKEIADYRPVDLTYEFSRTLLRELNSHRELKNLQEFIKNFPNTDEIVFPNGYPELTSNKILTMDFIDGISIEKQDKIKELNVDTQDIAKIGVRTYMQMIFEDSFYHADPHPGNFLVVEGKKVGLIDCGMIGRLDAQTRDSLEDLIIALSDTDIEELTEVILKCSEVPSDFNKKRFTVELNDFLQENKFDSISDIRVGDIVNDLMNVLREHRISFDSNILMLLKTLVMLEGSSRLLDRDFDLWKFIEPQRNKAIARRFHPQSIIDNLFKRFRNWDNLFKSLPKNIMEIIEGARTGAFAVHLDHRGLNAVINRLVYGIMSAALFLLSGMLLSADVKPLVNQVSLLGILSMLLALWLGLKVVSSVKKSGGLTEGE
jgi:ubiquinone biosynthesis protein